MSEKHMGVRHKTRFSQANAVLHWSPRSTRSTGSLPIGTRYGYYTYLRDLYPYRYYTYLRDPYPLRLLHLPA